MNNSEWLPDLFPHLKGLAWRQAMAAYRAWQRHVANPQPDNPQVRHGERGDDAVGDYVDVLFGVKRGKLS